LVSQGVEYTVVAVHNTSVQQGFGSSVFPTEFKKAVVRPLLEKDGLDATQMRNYTPVSNLSFLSKLLEKIVQKRLQIFWTEII